MSSARRQRNANGEGTVYKRADGRWAAQVYVDQTDGTRKRRMLYGKTKREVENKMLDLRRRSESGRPIPPLELTVGAYLQDWLDNVVAVRVRGNTLAGYRYHADRYVVPDLGSRSLGRLTAREVRQYVETLRDRGVGARTIQYVHGTLRAALEDAMREEILEKNVAKLVRVPRHEKKEPEPLSVAEIRTFLRSSQNDRLYALYVVLALLGLRRSEALGLRWDDIDLEQGLLMVRHGLQRIDGRLQLLPPKTARSRRTVPLPSFVSDALIAHQHRQNQERLDLGGGWPDLGFVFTTPVGTPIDPRNCTRVVQKALSSAGVRAVRLHDFRHGCVSVLLASGVPPRTTMEIVGHTTVDMTMNVYGHVTLDDKRAALEGVSDLFGPGGREM